MAESTNYQPVTTAGNGKQGAVATSNSAGAGAGAGASKSGLLNRLPFLRTKRGIAVTVIAILVIIGGGLAGLAALRNRNGNGGSGNSQSGGTSNAITSDTHFYGQSPPVYPSRELSTLTPGRASGKGQMQIANMVHSKHHRNRPMGRLAPAGTDSRREHDIR